MPARSERCTAVEPTQNWPYVKRCIEPSVHIRVYVDPLHETHDLCEDHYQQLMES